MPELVYCSAGERRFAEIALAHGYRYGARLPHIAYFPLWFADQDWRRPERGRYMAALADSRPTMATVLDWERTEQLTEVLDWAEEAAQFVEDVVVVPKVSGELARIPERVGTARVVLGYSVPTRFAGTEVPLWEFAGRAVHLLGGSPQMQMHVWAHLTPICAVVSADGNMARKLAVERAQFWVPGNATYARNRWWPTLAEAGDGAISDGAPYEAFRRSCVNIRTAWERRAAS